jgi:hypothetical protein
VVDLYLLCGLIKTVGTQVYARLEGARGLHIFRPLV